MRPRVALAVGSRARRDVAAAVQQRLAAGADVTVLRAESAPGLRQAIGAAKSHHDVVVTLGGDGTAHLAIQELACGDVPLGVVPAGTGNDIAATLGMSADPVAAAGQVLAALQDGSAERRDLGVVDAAPPRWWYTVLCAGFDSAVNETANRLRWPRGPRRYDVAIALEVLRLAPRHYRLVLDGVAEELDAALVSVANAGRYGGGKLIAPGARLDDGVFCVCVVAPVTRRTLLRLAPKLDTGGHVGHPKVSFRTARKVTIEADRVAYADGERIGPLPVTTRCAPAALPVLVAGTAASG